MNNWFRHIPVGHVAVKIVSSCESFSSYFLVINRQSVLMMILKIFFLISQFQIKSFMTETINKNYLHQLSVNTCLGETLSWIFFEGGGGFTTNTCLDIEYKIL